MKNKKKPTVAILMATALGISAIMCPAAVYAQEDDPAAITQESDTETEPKKETTTEEQAPVPALPQELTGNAGQTLQDITLPDGWNWMDGNTIISKENRSYPARFTVDDTTYDYSTVDGYHADGQYVERMVAVAVEPTKTEQEPTKEQKPAAPNVTQFSTFGTETNKGVPFTPRVGEVVINDTNFPDPKFKEYVSVSFDTNTNGELSDDELSAATRIDISRRSDIKSIQGVEYFTSLKTLICFYTGITELDVSSNTKLEVLNCNNTPLTSLNVSGADALDILYCYGSQITSLDVSNNTKLTLLYCQNTPLAWLDIGDNINLSESDIKTSDSFIDIKVTGNTFNIKDKFNGIDPARISNTSGGDIDPSTGVVSGYQVGVPVIYTYYCGTADGNPVTYDVSLRIQSVEINMESFPDEAFRKYVIDNFDKSKDNSLTANEIKSATTIDITHNKGIKSLNGIEHFTSLTTLNCGSTGITALNVSNNRELTNLDCSSTGITALDVSNNGKLANLGCNSTGITALNVSNNLELTNLFCSNTKIKALDVSKNSKLNDLRCHNNAEIAALDVSSNTNLTQLHCYNTQISVLNVSNNAALKYLKCDNAKIAALDVSQNKLLEYLYCYNNIGITDLNVSNNNLLKELNCYNTGISGLDVSNNTKLTYLNCGSTKITALDISNNKLLEYLYCSNNTGISALDVSNSAALTYLDCSGTEITGLDTGTNPNLIYLYCFKTKIESLDVGKNINLEELNCSNTQIKELNLTMLSKLKKLWTGHTGIRYLNVSDSPDLKLLETLQTNLAYLDWGTADLDELYMDSSTIDLTVTGDTFDLTQTQVFAGFDMSKMTVISGGTLDGNNITGYKVGTPVIYTYGCGTANGNPVTLDVTLNLSKSDSTIDITGNLDMSYSGSPVANPTVDTTGSVGAVTFTYEAWNGSAWEPLSGAPANAGKYRIQANLAADGFYNGAQSLKKEFTISQAANGWTDNLSITGWTYGENAVLPTAKANFGDVIFSYSDSQKGTYTDTVPTDAGTWYVKAIVTGTDNYTELETALAFTIAPKNADKNSQIVISDIKNDKDVENLVIRDGDKELKKGTDYDVDKIQNVNKVTVTITFKGNYTGTVTKTYTMEDKKTSGDTGTTKPSGSAGTTKPSGDAKNDKNRTVQTGDTAAIGLWALLMAFSAGTVAFLKNRKRKEETEK